MIKNRVVIHCVVIGSWPSESLRNKFLLINKLFSMLLPNAIDMDNNDILLGLSLSFPLFPLLNLPLLLKLQELRHDAVIIPREIRRKTFTPPSAFPSILHADIP